jgi:hypothetical protein
MIYRISSYFKMPSIIRRTLGVAGFLENKRHRFHFDAASYWNRYEDIVKWQLPAIFRV